MFDSSLIESSAGTRGARFLWTRVLSFLVELLLLSFAILAPLLYTEALPRKILDVVACPSPPPAAPAPRTSTVVSHPTSHSELNNGQVMLPSMIPHHVNEIHDEPTGDATVAGDPRGVVGAVPSGPSIGIVASLLDAVPPTIPKSVAPHSIRVSSGVAQGLLIREVRPQYPALARSARIQGTVVLQAMIGKDGSIQNLRLLSGDPLLTQAAMDAVRQWRYRPYLLNNEPIAVDTTIHVNFTLNGAN